MQKDGNTEDLESFEVSMKDSYLIRKFFEFLMTRIKVIPKELTQMFDNSIKDYSWNDLISAPVLAWLVTEWVRNDFLFLRKIYFLC